MKNEIIHSLRKLWKLEWQHHDLEVKHEHEGLFRLLEFRVGGGGSYSTIGTLMNI